MSPQPAPVLYIHAYNHTYEGIVSAGGIGLMNALPYPKLGRYAEEVTDEEVRAARVVLLEAHWFLSLGAIEGIVRAVRERNPGAAIIAGGLTASFYGELFRRRFGVDFVVGGDAELTLPDLVSSLLENREPPRLPLVWDGRGETPGERRLLSREFDAIDWITCDWFPSLQRRTVEAHAYFRENPGSASLFHPVLLGSRGCPRACACCVGAYAGQVFGPQLVPRSGAALLRDLQRLEDDPEMAFVSLVLMDATVARRAARALRGRGSRLSGQLYVCGQVSEELVADLSSGFAGEVTFLIVYPGSVAAVGSPPALVPDEKSFCRALRALLQLPGRRALVYCLEAPSAELTELANASGSRVSVQPGGEWMVRQPDVRGLQEGQSAPEQLEDLVRASRSAAAGFFLNRLVPGLSYIPVTGPVPLPNRDRTDDPFVGRLIDESERMLLHRRAYGFEELELTWTASAVPRGFEVGLVPPGAPLHGAVDWAGGLNGYCWQGEVTLENAAPLGLGLSPVVVTREGRIPLADWERARVPTVPIAPGPERTVTVTGQCHERGLEINVVDRGVTTRHWLRTGRD